MDIIIAGAGEVGRHAAAVLADDGHQITLIDVLPARLEEVGNNLDARTLCGAATQADVLLEAGADRADLFVAATDADETNLLAASIAKGLGTGKTIARVHHRVYHAGVGLDYGRHFHIDQLVCPEHLTSLAIAGVLRDPAVHAIEHFARGKIVMEQLEISDRAEVAGTPLSDLDLPGGLRIGTVARQGRAIVPTAQTVLNPGDRVALVGTTGVFEKVLPRFRRGELHRRKVAIMGGSSISVWLTRALKGKSFSVKMYLTDRARAEELSEKLAHATIIEADATDPDVFAEENIADADAFVALTNDDEDNILGALQAKHLGVELSLAAINRSTYHDLIVGLGIDRVFSPRIVAAREIQRLTQQRAVQQIAALDDHGTGIYEIDVASRATAVGMNLRQLPLPAGCVLVAIQRGDDVRVPGPRDVLAAGHALVAIAHADLVKKLDKLFA